METYASAVAANVAAENPNVKFDFITPIIAILIPMLTEWLKGCGGTASDVGPLLKADREANDGVSYSQRTMRQATFRAKQACRRAKHPELVHDRDFIESLAIHSLEQAEATPASAVATAMGAV